MNNSRKTNNTKSFSCQGESANWELDSEIDASVIIPTFERPETLKHVLTSLESQKYIQWTFEIVVVDDGSKDSTPNILQEFAEQTDLPFKHKCLAKNSGPAKARNCAISLSRGRLIIIIGDDIEPNPEFIKQHIMWHDQNSQEFKALLGFITWPKGMNANNFMQWLENGGHAFFFDYLNMKDGMEVDPARYFYTCNVSLKRSMLFKTSLFDETFPHASHEDIELGYRLRKAGMKLYFYRSAEGYHWHNLNVRDISKRVYLMGYSARQYWEKVVDNPLIGIRTIRRLIASVCALPFARLVLKSAIRRVHEKDRQHPFLWKMILILSFWIGVSDTMGRRIGSRNGRQ